MIEGNRRGAIIYSSGMENKTISRQFAPNESSTLLEYVLDSVWTVADELFVVFKSEPELSLVEDLSHFGVRILTTAEGQSPILAVCEAFRSASSEHCLLATERIPLLKPNVALALFENAQGLDLAIPRWKNGRIEPLLAVYRRKSFVRVAETSSKRFTSDLKSDLDSNVINRLFAVKYVAIDDELKFLDPELDSFLDVRDEKSLKAARDKASIRGKRTTRQAK